LIRFKVGDSVRWVKAVASPEFKNAVGIVELVIPSNTDGPKFDIYNIEFEFGTRTLYGTQIEAE
jgi:hypothetical protein